MKEYIKPDIEIIELRTEEMLALGFISYDEGEAP